jgi:hypothetical protein
VGFVLTLFGRVNAVWEGFTKKVLDSAGLSARPITSVDVDRTAKKLAFVCQQTPIW